MIKYVAAFVALCGSFAPVGPISTVDTFVDWEAEVALRTEIMAEVNAGDEERYIIIDNDVFSQIESDMWPFVYDAEVTVE